jgi:hypothetical protein
LGEDTGNSVVFLKKEFGWYFDKIDFNRLMKGTLTGGTEPVMMMMFTYINYKREGVNKSIPHISI